MDLGLYATQEDVNALTWIFPGEMAAASMQRALENAPNADAIVVNGMPNFEMPLPAATHGVADGGA